MSTATRPRPAGAAPHRPPARLTPAPSTPTWPGWLPEASLALLLVVSALAFGRVYRGGGWEGSALAPVVTAIGVVALTRRFLRTRLLAVPLDTLAVLLVVVWTVVPGSTTAGLPLVHTWRSVARVLSGFGRQFEAAVPPVDPTRAFLLLTAAGVGGAGLAAAWLRSARGRRARALAPAPAVVMFLAGCILGGPDGRVLSVLVEILVLGVHLLVEHAANSADPSLWVAGAAAPALERQGRVGSRILVLAAVAAAVVSALPGPDGHGVIGWKTIGRGNGTRIIVSPMVSISTRIVDNAKADVFSVRSSAPAYWQLTTLDEYSGGTWQAGRASYEDFSGRLPTGGAVRRDPKGTREVVEHFHIQALDSPWLPSAFDPVAVTGTSGVQYNPGTGSLLSKRPTADGETYTVTAIERLATLDARKLEAAPGLTHANLPAESTSLPSSVPSQVGTLARRIVAHAHSEYAEALALQDYFYGPEFTYSLHPPVDGTGVDAIDTFLFKTRTGYCQQFAGSFAVMARSLGLPTRLAVGFTTGRRIGPDRYQVTDADVHTWPEVWFPRYGWVPFEPTKGAPGAGFAIPGARAVTGDTSRVASVAKRSTGSHPSGSTAPTTPGTTVPSGGSSNPVSTARRAGDGHQRQAGRPGAPTSGAAGASVGSRPITGGSGSSRSPHPATSNLAWAVEGLLVAVAAAGGLAIADLCAAAVRRRRRRGRIRAAGPGSRDAALLNWEDLTEALATVGIRRKVWESAPHFAVRAGWSLDPTGRLARELAAAGEVVDTVSWAGPALRGAPPDISATAAEVRRRVERRRRLRDRLRLAFDVRLCWRPAPLERDGELPQPPEAPRLAVLPERPEPVGAGGRLRDH